MKSPVSAFLAALVVCSSHAVADEPQPQTSAGIQKEHEFLQRFVGRWETTSEAIMKPGQPPVQCKGEVTARSLGGLWVIWELKSEMQGVPISAVQTLGYDAKKKKYIGTWVDSMVNFFWKYEGTVDKTGRKLTFEAEGPNYSQDGKPGKFRDSYEFKSKDEITLTSQMLGPDGKWITFMNGVARRVKAKK